MTRIFYLLLLACVFITACHIDEIDLPRFGDDDDDIVLFPEVIDLPDGFMPEGIVAGFANDFYVGSLGDGSIYRGDFRTGLGDILIPGQEGSSSVGLAFDIRTGLLYVAGGATGGGRIIDTRRATVVAEFDFGGGFVNDVIVAFDGAYFTDSFSPTLYKVSLRRGGRPNGEVEAIPLGDNFAFEPGQFNANGIEVTPAGRFLLVVNTFTGELYRIDPDSGLARPVNLGGESLPNADGILLRGNRLFVVQNFLNQISVVDLRPDDFLRGEITEVLTDPDFRIPTTVTARGFELYAVNARFDVAPPGVPAPGVDFEVVKVDQ